LHDSPCNLGNLLGQPGAASGRQFQ
jgi:hypothetical protein